MSERPTISDKASKGPMSTSWYLALEIFLHWDNPRCMRWVEENALGAIGHTWGPNNRGQYN